MFIRSLVWQYSPRWLMHFYAKLTILRKYDRIFLRNDVVPYFSPSGEGKALNIGVHYYTNDLHQTMLSHGFDLYTVDIDGRKRRWGVKAKHKVSDVASLSNIFPKKYFDFIVLFGILGYGIDNEQSRQDSFRSIYKVMKDDAVLVIAWDENISADPFDDEYFHSIFERRTDVFEGKRLWISNGLTSQNGLPAFKIFDFVCKKSGIPS